jgi:hypothetical protein
MAGKSYARAYLDAGDQCKPEHAPMAGYRLAPKPAVAKAINDGNQQMMAQLEISTASILHQLASIAFFDPRKMFWPDGSLKNLNDLDPDTIAGLGAMTIQLSDHGNRRVLRIDTGNKLAVLKILIGYLKKHRSSTRGWWQKTRHRRHCSRSGRSPTSLTNALHGWLMSTANSTRPC